MRVQISPGIPHVPLPRSNSLKGTTAAGPAPGLARGWREKGRGREGLGVVVLLARERGRDHSLSSGIGISV